MKHYKTAVLAGLLASGAVTGMTAADSPHLGGPMKHVLIFLDDNNISLEIEDGQPDERVELIRYEGESYDGAASVLDDKPYSARYGWLAGGFIALPANSSIWIEQIAQTPGLDTYEALTFDPIFGTSGSDTLWEWNGTMTHNWYTGSRVSVYDATYRVFIGDFAGTPLPDYNPAEITLHWTFHTTDLDYTPDLFNAGSASFSDPQVSLADGNVIPLPGTAVLLALPLALFRRRK